jgi:dihydroorotate dehydrogenase electron transfer subunit
LTVSEGVSAKELCGESDLHRAVDELAECTAILPLESTLFEISFHAPGMARLAQPGEFAQIWVEPGHSPLLRRPFSFSRADPKTGVVSFYLGVVGQGTRRLRSLSPGDSVRLLGPLGQGFTLPARPGRSALVSGGLGAAPFPLLAERLRERGEEMIWVNGARNRSELYPDELIPDGISEVIQFTEDGSRGRLGRVTAGLPAVLDRVDRVYACGPNPMLGAVAALVAESSSGTSPKPAMEASIEAPMGCGFGTCLGCAIPLKLPSATDSQLVGLCCRQGPVLRGGALDWERLMRQPAHLS